MSTIQDTASPIAEDTIDGAAAIGRHINKTERQALHLCATRQIPAYKMGGKWHLRKSRYARHVESLEEASVNAPARETRRALQHTAAE